jgi:protein-L-isoaspartate(D-aspartate) O-methyltransferase
MTKAGIGGIRGEFAQRIARLANLRSTALINAFAAVPRESFVGPGPWKIMRPADLSLTYSETPDDNPSHLYDTVTVALDASRNLNNGEPASLARWLDELTISPGIRFLHVGCGTGYYTAVIAHAVSREGSVVALEADPLLADRAKRNLAVYSNVEVRCAATLDPEDEAFGAIFINAGATDLQPAWLDQLRLGGRLLVPLTVSLPDVELGLGQMLLVERRKNGYIAHFVTSVGIFHCVGSRSDKGNDLLRDAFQRCAASEVRGLRRDQHEPTPECWLHSSSFCLSSQPLDDDI